MRFDIILIILGGLFLRLYRIQDFYMFLADQGRDAVIIRRILLLQKFPLIGPPSSIGEVFLGPFYYYLVAPFLWIFQLNPVGLAIGVGILSICAGIVMYYIVRKVVSREVALIFSLFVSCSGLLVDIGRFSWNPNLLPYFSFITLSLFFLSLHGKRKMLYSLLFGIFFGLSFQLHHLAALLVIPIALYFLLFLFKKRDFSAIRVPFLSALGFALTLLPFALFEIRHNFLNIRNLISLFTKQNLVSSGPFINRFFDVASSVVQFAFHITVPSPVAIVTIFLMLGSVIYFLRKKGNPFIILHLIAFVSLLFGLSRVNAQAIPHYFHTVYISFYLLLAFILYSLIKNKLKPVVFILITLFVLMQVSSYTFIWKPAAAQYKLPEQIGREIANDTKGKRINLATYPTDFTSRDCYQYFIEINGGSVVDGSSNEIANTLYVLCDKKPCRVIKSDSWSIQMFGDAKIDRMWNRDGVTIYRLIHR